MSNTIPCPKCENISGFIDAKDKGQVIKKCYVCNDTLLISEEHQQLLDLRFKETFDAIDEYSLTYHLRERNTPYYINFKIKVDSENVPYVASTDIFWMERLRFDTVADVIRFIKNHNRKRK